jgi:hypothetical protein
MWTNITSEGTNVQWVVDALYNVTANWVTYGSYNIKTSPTVIGVG